MNRFSSRRGNLSPSFLADRLKGAEQYDRIAGYFRSSLLDVAGEAIESIVTVRVVCNSSLHPRDVETARQAHNAMRREWCAGRPEDLADEAGDRFARLYRLLRSGQMEVRVLPDETFGLVHGKAGVIRWPDGAATSFLGSANATRRGWTSNYELIWEDDRNEAVAWVQEEFDALWGHSHARPLAEAVVEDIGRLSKRTVYHSVDDWRANDEDPASAVIEAPVYREGFGLWEHQKYFIKTAFDAHKTSFGARYVLGDMVGLGKTIQLAVAAQLMALHDEGRVLVLAPKTLLSQWQDELESMLGIPSAVWDSQRKRWVDEQGVEHPAGGYEGIARCPRRIGLVSHGVITHARDEAKEPLLGLRYTCVIVDEAHNARRRNLGEGKADEEPDPNNLLRFLMELGPKTHSLLLATATPVQMYPVEAWDLLNVLNQGRKHVLGTRFSPWQTEVEKALGIVVRNEDLPEDGRELWKWMRDPLPPAEEDRAFEKLRRRLRLSADDAVAKGGTWEDLRRPDQALIRQKRDDLAEDHHPFIRFIVRRTRNYLETTSNPDTGEPYLDPIEVELLGEDPDEAISLPGYLQDAYDEARSFCELISRRMSASGFMKTQLLRRMGSTIHAGRLTTERILQDWKPITEEQAGSDTDDVGTKTVSPDERQHLENILAALNENVSQDPKYQRVVDLLVGEGWLQRGCIVFSQFYESIFWLAEQLSGNDLPSEPIGVYGARAKSGIMKDGTFERRDRDKLKEMIRDGQLRLLVGTESASEGLNLQRLSTLINLDLPWNPTRLEQRKGRIQRIGQAADRILIYNMRYRGSVEDRVHELLSERLEQIHNLFGQIPDMLEDAWVDVALNRIEDAQQTIGKVPDQHPFEIRYDEIDPIDWESCAEVLADKERRRALATPW